MVRRLALLIALSAGLFLPTTGCSALIDATFRESRDHGRRARYENKSFGGHFVDALVEDDGPRCRRHRRHCDCHTTVVVVRR